MKFLKIIVCILVLHFSSIAYSYTKHTSVIVNSGVNATISILSEHLRENTQKVSCKTLLTVLNEACEFKWENNKITINGAGLYEFYLIKEPQADIPDLLWKQQVYIPHATPSNASELANKHLPIIVFNSNEEFFPTSLDSILNHGSNEGKFIEVLSPYSTKTNDNKPKLKMGSEIKEFLTYNGSSDSLLNMNFLSTTVSNSVLPPNFFRNFKSSPQNSTIYWDASVENSKIYLTYYFFYAFDPKIGNSSDPYLAAHAFDRESFTIILDKVTEQPLEVVYAGHLSKQKMKFYGSEAPSIFDGYVEWENAKTRINWKNINKISSHPVIYKAQGSHAIFPAYGYYRVINTVESQLTILDEEAGSINNAITVNPNEINLKQLDLNSSDLKPLAFSGGWVDVIFGEDAKFPPFIKRAPYSQWVRDSVYDFKAECFGNDECDKYFETLYGTEKLGAVQVNVPDNDIKVGLRSTTRNTGLKEVYDDNTYTFFYDRSEQNVEIYAQLGDQVLACSSFDAMTGNLYIFNQAPSRTPTSQFQIPIVECSLPDPAPSEVSINLPSTATVEEGETQNIGFTIDNPDGVEVAVECTAPDQAPEITNDNESFSFIAPILSNGVITTSFKVTCTAFYSETESISDTTNIIIKKKIIPEVNIPPVARITHGDLSNIVEGDTVTFNGDTSTDTEGAIKSYSWKDGTQEVGSLATLTLTNLSKGIHLIRLTVTDSEDESHTTVVRLEVKEKPADNTRPTARITSESDLTKLTEGDSIILKGDTSSDEESNISSYLWEEGDQVIGTGIFVSLPDLIVGKRFIKLTVKDSEGLEHSAQIVLDVAEKPADNTPPTAKITSESDLTNLTEGDSITLKGDTSSDEEGNIASYLWKEGEQVLGTGLTVSLPNLTKGKHFIKLTVKDSEGLEDSAQIVFDVAEKLSAPTNIKATAGDRLVTVSWDAVPNAASYSICSAEQSILDFGNCSTFTNGTLVQGITGTTKQITGLTNDTTYYFRVIAINLEGISSAPSNEVEATPLADTLQNGLVAHYEFNGNVDDSSGNNNDGVGHGLNFTTINGRKIVELNSIDESRLQLPYSYMPVSGSLVMNINVNSGYRYSNSVFSNNLDSALIFTTDIQGGDVTYAGSSWFTVSRNGNISFSIATSKYGNTPRQTIKLDSTNFSFDEWHQVGISFGNEGQKIYLDGEVIVENNDNKEPLGAGGNHSSSIDIPTIGESVSGFWSNNEHEGGFNGMLDEVFIYNRALNSSEIKELYNGEQVTNQLVVNAGLDQTITLGDSVTLDGSGSSSNNTIVAYEWKDQNGQILSNNVSFTTSTLAVGTWTITLTATDDAGNTASNDVVIIVQADSSENKTTISYMKSHPDERLASTDCKDKSYNGWKGAKSSLISDLAPADKMMKSIEGCIGVKQLNELGGLSFDKAVESVVRFRTKESSPFSDVYDTTFP